MRRPNRFDLVHLPLSRYTHLSLKRLGEVLEVLLDRAVLREELDVGAVHLDVAGVPLLDVLVAAEGGEAPVLGDNDLLPAGELVLRATEGLERGGTVWTCWLAYRGFRDVGRGGAALLESRVRTEMRIWPMLTRATTPLGLPNAPRIPV